MTDLTRFEQRLRERLARELDRGGPTFDADRIAASAMVQRRPIDRVLNRLALGPLPVAMTRTTALVAVAGLLALVTIALAVGVGFRGSPSLAFIRPNGDVVIAAGDGSEATVIYRVPSPVHFTTLALAPDGAHLALVDEDLQLLILDRTGNETHRTAVEAGFSMMAWSPDSKRLAVLDGSWRPPEPWMPGTPERHGIPVDAELEIVGIDGSIDWAVPLPDNFFFDLGRGYLAWSRDSRSIAVTGSVDTEAQTYPPSSLWLVDLADRTVRELPGEPASFPGDRVDGVVNYHSLRLDFLPAWLPDGRLVFSRFNSGIWQIDPRTGSSSMIYELTAQACAPGCRQAFADIIEPSPDGTRLLFWDPFEGFSILDLATGAVTVLRPAEDGGFMLPSFSDSPVRWTADGRGIVLWGANAQEVSSVAAIDIATGDVRVLITGTRFFEYTH